MVLVVDEHGGIDGLVTVGDVIEAVLGEIRDEYDIEDKPVIFSENEYSFIVDARAELEELENLVHLDFLDEDEEEDVDTVGGFVAYFIGRLPVRGEIVTHEETGTQFEILEADPRRLKKLRVIVPEPSETEDE